MSQLRFFLASIACFVVTIELAFGQGHPGKVPLPEPGMLSLVAVGVAAAAITYRFRNKK